jgi:hypothetical protein
MKLLAAVAAVSAIAALLDVSLFVHYVAPLISVLIVLSFVVLCRLSRMRGTDPFAAKAISAVLLTAMLAWPVIQMARALTGSDVTLYRPQSRMDRYNIEQQITNTPGRHVIVVRYGRNRDFEWVYNGATIDAQRVIWAHDLGDERDRALMDYYPGRRFWRVLVDTPRTTVTPLR